MPRVQDSHARAYRGCRWLPRHRVCRCRNTWAPRRQISAIRAIRAIQAIRLIRATQVIRVIQVFRLIRVTRTTQAIRTIQAAPAIQTSLAARLTTTTRRMAMPMAPRRISRHWPRSPSWGQESTCQAISWRRSRRCCQFRSKIHSATRRRRKPSKYLTPTKPRFICPSRNVTEPRRPNRQPGPRRWLPGCRACHES